MVGDIKTEEERRRKKKRVMREVSAPQFQIKARSLPTASAFESPRQDRESSHVTAVSQCHRSERESASRRETGRARGRDRKTDGEGGNGTMAQTERRGFYRRTGEKQQQQVQLEKETMCLR